MVDIFSDRYRSSSDHITDGKFPGDKGGHYEPGEQFEIRIM